MKKWLRRILIAAALVGLTFGVLYECATHVGRGWLFGEAFYEGRPTSYWRSRIDRWVALLGSPEEAEKAMRHVCIFRNPGDWRAGMTILETDGEKVVAVMGIGHINPAETTWQHLLYRLGQDPHAAKFTPGVLAGINDAEPVWRELESQGAYRLFIVRARKNAGLVKDHDRFD
jgi:hypothetical protein